MTRLHVTALGLLVALSACGDTGPAPVVVFLEDADGNVVLEVSAQVADTEAARAEGLRGYDTLPADEGLLLAFPSEGEVCITNAGVDFAIDVVYASTDGTVVAMERHPDIELLVPITGPMIQVVAPGRDLADATEQPRAEEAIAFVLQPGEAVVVAPGVWHSAAMPVAEETLYMFAGLPHAPEPGREASPWIAFEGDSAVTVAG